MNFWDQQYSTPDFKYGTQANWFLRNQAAHLHPGSEVLLPGDGEGRNSVWLARRGHHVTALDNSKVGLDKALRLASENKVTVGVIHADLEHWIPPPDSFDAVVLTYVHLPASWRRMAHQRLVSALRPGGWLILEAFHPKQLRFSSGGPKDEAMLYTAEMIRSDLADEPEVILDEVLAWEGEAHLDEGSGHQGSAYLTRYVAHRVKSRKTNPGETMKAFQDYYPENVSHCYGCGSKNIHGHRIKTFWEGEETVTHFTPEPYHTAIPGFTYGGLIASLIDRHSTGTAAAAMYRASGREMDTLPPFRFVTGSLHVDYLKPTPIDGVLEIRGRIKEIKGRKVVVESTVFAKGVATARGEVVALQMPDGFGGQ